jgi:hypothetical protein
MIVRLQVGLNAKHLDGLDLVVVLGPGRTTG